MVSCPVSTRTRRPYPSSICGYRATPTDVSPIANLCRIIMPVHRLWSPRTRRYADLISCFESGLSQWIMGLDTAPLSCSLISFSEDLLSSFIGRPRSHATVRPFSIFKTGFVAFVFPICRGNRVSSFPSFFFFPSLSVTPPGFLRIRCSFRIREQRIRGISRISATKSFQITPDYDSH